MPLPRKYFFNMPFTSPRKEPDNAENARAVTRAINALPIFDKQVFMKNPGVLWSNSTTTYAPFFGTTGGVGYVSGEFYKYDSNTKLFLTTMGTFWASALVGKATVGVEFEDLSNGDVFTYDVAMYYFNALGDHRTFAATITVTDLPAGRYYVTLVGKADTGQTLNADANDHAGLTVEERPTYA